jgi:uncharacterized protein
MSADGQSRFQEEVTSEAQLRQIVGAPARRAVDKVIDRIDRHAREFIELSPFVLVASHDGQGGLDVSPKGDPPGFVRVVDPNTVAIPDRPGNRRTDTFLNVLREPAVALLFMIPGKAETLRVTGRATIVRDAELRSSLSVQSKLPELALVISVREVFFHCARCVIRSRLWQSESWPDSTGLASHAKCIVDHARLAEPLEAVQAALDSSYRDRLY